MADVTVNNQGSIVLFTPETATAREWITENVADDAMYFGPALVVEHRYAGDLIGGMTEAGLEVTAA